MKLHPSLALILIPATFTKKGALYCILLANPDTDLGITLASMTFKVLIFYPTLFLQKIVSTLLNKAFEFIFHFKDVH